jgi:outer membrane protein assembly factor BamB
MGWSPFRKTGLTYYHPAASTKGYTIVTPTGESTTYLIDMSGQVVHEWRYPQFRGFYGRLLPNGNLIMLATDSAVTAPPPPEGRVPTWTETVRRIGGNATHIVEMDWDGHVVWQYENADIHHDFVRMPNGNTLVAGFIELRSEVERAVRGGYRERLMPPMISDDFLEVDRDGKEVRRVSLWKLLDPRRDPICGLERRLEWTHTNSLDVDAEGRILFSCRTNSRIGIIAADGESLVWKYGFPDISHQHHATFLANGNVQVFDNGMHRRGMPRSSIVEVNPKDSSLVWQYTADPDIQFLSAHISGADRLAGGNVLVCEGATGRLFEVTQKKEIVWEWVSPFSHRGPQGNLMNWIFRAYRYEPDYAGLSDRELDPGKHAATNRLYGLGE